MKNPEYYESLLLSVAAEISKEGFSAKQDTWVKMADIYSNLLAASVQLHRSKVKTR